MSNASGKVFGIGLSKTGTTSLTKALNILGVKSIHYPWDETTYAELRRGEYRLSLLRDYDGVTDTPVAPFFAQLDRAWPDSKFILTIRDKPSWLRSAESHWKGYKQGRHAGNPRFAEFADFISACVYGCVEFNAERFSYAYDTHVELVTRYFENRPDDLLVLDICGGAQRWDALATFLGRDHPGDLPFPHEFRTGGRRDHVDPAEQLARAVREVGAAVPQNGTVILVDQQELGDALTGDRERIPFLEIDNVYWGNPEDDASAIAAVERLRTEKSASHIVFAWPSFWWFKHYPIFVSYLRSRYSCIQETNCIVVFDLASTSR